MRISLSVLFLFLSLQVQAQSQQKFTWGGIFLFGVGQTGNDTDVLSRGMAHMPVSLFMGYNLNKFRLGLNYEYDIIGQTADPADFSGQNIAGKAGAAALRLEFYDGRQAFGILYRVSEQYKLDRPTLTGNTSVYDMKSGYGVQYYRQIRKKIGFVIDYAAGEYKNENGLTDDIRWNRISLGMILTNFKNSR